MIRILTKILTEDTLLNRIQDHLIEVLNPVLRRVGSEDYWHTVGASGEPRFENSWVSNGDTWIPQFTRLSFGDGRYLVAMRGLVKNGTLGLTAFTLPEGYRPGQHTIFTSPSNTAFGRLDVHTDGRVIPAAGSTVDMSLAPAVFVAEDV